MAGQLDRSGPGVLLSGQGALLSPDAGSTTGTVPKLFVGRPVSTAATVPIPELFDGKSATTATAAASSPVAALLGGRSVSRPYQSGVNDRRM